MKLKISDDTLIVFIYILSSLMLLGQFMGISLLTSFAFSVHFIVVFLLWLLHIRKVRVLDILSIFIIILSLVGVVVTYTTLSASYFNNWLMFAAVFLYFSVCIKIKLKKATVKTLFIINFAVSTCCLLLYFLRYNDIFYTTNMGVKYLIFNFYNPNSLALFLVIITIIGMQFFSLYKVKFGLLMEICFVGIFVFLIVQTLSRTSLLVILFFIIISIIFARRKYYYLPKNSIFKTIVTLFPILFAGIYMLVIDIINKNGILSFLVSEGKGLDSRQYVWSYAFDLFKESPFIGSYGFLATSSEFSQMHNSHINVLVSYGFIVFVLTLIFLYIVLKDSIIKSSGNKTALSVWGFIVCLMLGAGEAILFSGGLSFYLLVGQLLLISNASVKDEGELNL